MFFEAYDDAEPYDFLDKLICQWRIAEDATRSQCGLPSVTTQYPGCFGSTRGTNSSTATTTRRRRFKQKYRRRLSESSSRSEIKTNGNETEDFGLLDMTAHDIILGKGEGGHWTLEMDASDFMEPDDVEWGRFLKAHEKKRSKRRKRRRLINYDNVGPWTNYFLMHDVKTEVRLHMPLEVLYYP